MNKEIIFIDFHKKKMDYYEKALNLSKRCKNPFNQLVLSSKMQLLNYKKKEIKKVRILSTCGCGSCKKQNGKVFLIDEAIRKMPVPNKNCSYRLYPKNKKYGFCRCVYIPLVKID